MVVYSYSLHSLFAAQAGASKVIAIDGSSKMASVATQVLIVVGQEINFSMELRVSLCVPP